MHGSITYGLTYSESVYSPYKLSSDVIVIINESKTRTNKYCKSKQMYSLINACVFPLPKLSSGFVDAADVSVLTGVLSDERANKPAGAPTLGVSRVQI